LTGAGGRTGEAAKAVAKILHAHFVKENEYALPPLSLLVPLSQGAFDAGMAEVLKLTDKLAADMPVMLAEHQDVVAALRELTDAATAENKPEGAEFARMLTAHAQMEEEVTYPTAFDRAVRQERNRAWCTVIDTPALDPHGLRESAARGDAIARLCRLRRPRALRSERAHRTAGIATSWRCDRRRSFRRLDARRCPVA